MRINEDYRILAEDKMNIQLQRRKVVQDKQSKNYGKETWTTQAYCCSFKSALKTFLDWEVNETGLKDLETIINKIEEVQRSIDNLNI